VDTLTVAPAAEQLRGEQPRAEQSRACYPDETGYVERDGVRVYWEAYGHGEPTVLLLPTWSLVHSRLWKAQIPYLARHFRTVTFDPRGNGRSDRPHEIAAYAEAEFARDALDVMDATGTDQAILVGNSRGVQRGLLLAAEHPERVLGAVFIGAMFPASRIGGLRMRLMNHPRIRTFFLRRPLSTRGWLKFNAQHLRANYDDFVDWFVGLCLTEPHSTKQIEDMTEWAHETDPETLIRTLMAPYAAPLERSKQLELAGRVRCPVLVIHGRHDRVRAYADGRELARATGARLLTIEDAGHVPHARKPVPVNLAVRDFVAAHDPALAPAAPRDPTVHRADGRKRALFVSSPIGLGHARRDVAIARELRALVPNVQIDWLAQDPVTRVLEAEGETIHPASEHLASESGHFESECAEHDLHCFQALRRMDEILVANFMLFHDVVSERRYDLWIADEGWEIDYFLHENPGLKRAHYAWLTDFVGFLPMADGGSREAFLTADYNAEMVEHIAAHPQLRDRSIFVGNADDIVSEPLGPDLPMIRDWTERNFEFAGYITGFEAAALSDHEALRAELGYASDERVCVVTVGGSGVGSHLLRRVIDAYPEAKQRVPDLRMIVVAGPRIDPQSLPRAEGLDVRPYVHDLYRHLAACDLAVVQGGLTTAMELTANKRPFLYFPLRHHFEQSFHVRHRLDRYDAGRCMDFEASGPHEIAAAIADEIGRPVQYRDVETDGARRAAARLAEML
jgi:pimeloyl-ACP methyl ester carboxylesterase/predicted glycosyltransferase